MEEGECWAALSRDERKQAAEFGANEPHRTVTMFACGRERKACADVFGLQGRKIGQDLTFSHPTGEVFEDIGDRDPRPFDARLTAANSRRDRDVVLEPHSS